MAARVVAAAETMLAKAGAVVSYRMPAGRAVAQRRAGPAPRPVRDLAEAKRVLDLLRGIDPSGLDYDAWIRVGYGLKAALGEHGKSAWLAWSRASARHDGTHWRKGTPERMWRGIRPARCGWRYLERLHGQLVADGPLRRGSRHG